MTSRPVPDRTRPAGPLRRHLAGFAAALALPILVFVAALLWRVGEAERLRLEGEALDAARNVAVLVDREIAGLAAALDVLSLSQALRERDLATFHAQAAELNARFGMTAVLRDRSSRQLLNARVPWGTPLPEAGLPVPPASAWGERPLVSGLFRGTVQTSLFFAIQRAVGPIGEAGPELVLSLAVPVERIRAVIGEQPVPEGWVIAAVDGSGTILARSSRHDEFAGTPATPSLQQATATGASGTWHGTTADGRAVLGAFARSARTGWRIAVGVPEDLLTAPIRRSLWLLAGAGAALSGLSLLLALMFGRRIALPLQALEARAMAVGRGEVVDAPPGPIREAARIGEALATASRALRAREDELRRLNEVLDARVAERTRALEESHARLLAAAAEREQAEAQLRQSQKMESLGRLTGGVAHDFNNLLTVVIGNLGMARTRLEGGAQERALRSIEAAAEGARRAATLTQRLLAFSRQQPLAPVAIEVNQRVLAMSELLRRTLGEDVALETVLAGGLWRAEADPNQLESALLNLAVNARDAMPEGGRLTLETANAWLGEDYAAGREEVQPGQYVMVSVSDTGQGMPPEVAARAFEPFFTTKPPGKGTGLGLSQVYGFAKQSGGHVAIYSEPGHGTTVKLYLPRQRTAQPAAPAEAPAEAPAATGRGEVVLVLEDEEMVRDFAVAVLEEAGFRPLPAAEGEAALALLREAPDVRLLFTDVVLTGAMNGRRVADLASGMRPGLPVLFTTGYTRNAIIHHGRLDEGVNLLGKPYTAAALVQRVRALLDAAAAPGGPAG